jgi:hypothetical protein
MENIYACKLWDKTLALKYVITDQMYQYISNIINIYF